VPRRAWRVNLHETENEPVIGMNDNDCVRRNTYQSTYVGLLKVNLSSVEDALKCNTALKPVSNRKYINDM
jgi:hypothetical protein